MKMTAKEQREHRRLLKRWSRRRATMREMLRCMELDRKANREAREARS